MKKFISLMICVAMILSSVSAMADSDSLIVDTVKVNVSSGSVTLNDEEMSVSAAPYVNQNGDTMVDMYALVNVLGGEITEKDGVYSVTYDDVEIKYTLNSTDVEVAGQTLTMSSAVVVSDNGTVMAPLRFVSESLGADVTYNSESGEIVIVSAGGLDSGVNYKLLFKYTEKEKIGNSKEHWRFTKTDNFDMSESSYGSSYRFSMNDISFTLRSQKNDGTSSLEQYYLSMQKSYLSSYNRNVMYDKGKGEHNGVEYVYTKYRRLDTVTEAYAYKTDEYFCFITIQRSFENFETAKENTDVTAFLNSLEFDYKGGDEENTVDVAEIGLEKQLAGEEKSEYVDGNYRWSIKLNEDWSVNEYYGFYNKVTVIKPTSIETDDNFNYGYGYDYDDMYYYSSYSSVRDPLIMISTYSNPNRQSAADWAKKNRDDYEKTVNSEKYKISEIKETQIGQIKAYYFEENYSEDENEYVEKTYYMNYGDFRYKINLGYDKREEEAEGFKESADAVIKSFVPGEININELGDALESDSDIDALNVLNEFKGDIFSINYPCLWNISETDTGLLLAKDRSKNGMDTTGLLSVIFPNFSLMLSAADGSSLRAEKTSLSYYDDKLNKSTYTLEEYMYKNIAGMLNSSSSYLNISMPNEIEEVTLMGKKGYKADLVLTINGVNNVYYTMYFIPYDSENLITVIKACNESEKNTVYENALDKALNSLKLS